MAGEGTVDYNGSVHFDTPDASDDDSLSFTGELDGSGTTFDGSGIWLTDADAFGSWTLTSNED